VRQIDDHVQELRRRELATAEARERIFRIAESRQGTLATSFEDLLGDGGPDEETADEMIRAIREWRDMDSDRSLD
jgi:hypothetical protein